MKHILMVDDLITNLKFVGEILKDKYTLSISESGPKALLFLEKTKPDLILLNVNMPHMNGYETMDAIKNNPDTMLIPIIFITSDADRQSEIKGLRMGAMDFIRKPFEPEIMLSRIERVLQLEEDRKTLTITARKDALTGLWNRTHMEEELQHYLIQPRTEGFFLLLDIDNFKKVNDNFGHIIGDTVLVKYAEVLNDFFSTNSVVCRFGGDEFAVFLKGTITVEEVSTKVTGFIEQVESKLKKILMDSPLVATSIGISSVPEDGKDFHSLYSKADKALYFVKQNGKRGYHFFMDKEGYSYQHNEKGSIAIDLQHLKNAIEEKQYSNGAYQVEYDGFKNIYQFITRYTDRTNQNVQFVLFTLFECSNTVIDTEELFHAMKKLEQAIIVSLRRGDVATRYSSSQFVVILMDASEENGFMVVNRIKDTWTQINDFSGIDMEYDIRAIAREKESYPEKFTKM